MPSGFLNVFILALTSIFAFSTTALVMLVGSLVGSNLAPSTDLATLPIAIMVVGTALGVLPVSLLMSSIGRKNTLWVFFLLSIVICFLASHSLVIKSFSLFCFCTAMIGFSNAALHQIRFAAMESVTPNNAATAASIVMLSGVVAAFIGPELAVIGRTITNIEYQGSFWLVAGSISIAAVILIFFKDSEIKQTANTQSSRSIKIIIQSPSFRLAVASAAIGYIVMSFVMTGTPISMHNHFGHSLEDTKWVIQSHIAAMFLPSLFTPWLFRLFGIRGLMSVGLACYGLTIIIGLIDSSVMGFWSQLVILGIGWNFLFISGTTLLPRTYLKGDKFTVQGFNDSVVFSTQAIASLSAGWAISSTSWQAMLLACLIPIGLMLIILLRSNPIPASEEQQV
ncbi:MAG: MFS transporter [Pseudomonadales bacterium]|nr:MFS transporter [Pseudomonadales bacterium]